MENKQNTESSFYGLGIAPGLLKRLEKINFRTPTPIQRKSIPLGVAGKDFIGVAQTGTGKTLAFAIPMIQRIAATGAMGLVILPTRELAIQVDESFAQIANGSNLRTALLIGGAPIFKQKKSLRNNPHIIIATPGRLIDHLEQKNVSLDKVGVLVLDEADRMLDMGFKPQINKILDTVPAERQTMLFSATIPEEIGRLAKSYMKQPLRVEIAPSGTAAELVNQEVFIVPQKQKLSLLNQLLSQYHGTVLVFSRTRHGAKKIAKAVRDMGHTSAEIHSNRSLYQRKAALEGFKSGKFRVLVATDIAARGIDVNNIELVINFDLPDDSGDYVHRIGRTGRAGKHGKAISFAAPGQKRDLLSIERIIRVRLPIKPLPKFSEFKTDNKTADFQEKQKDENNAKENSFDFKKHKSGGYQKGGYKGKKKFKRNDKFRRRKPGGKNKFYRNK